VIPRRISSSRFGKLHRTNLSRMIINSLPHQLLLALLDCIDKIDPNTRLALSPSFGYIVTRVE